MISLALPTYNGEKYLREQLDSIFNQTMVPEEIVVVDDRSTDSTIQILEEYKQKYGLKYYINEQNLGYNKNFEKAITLCQGDYIALCDQDDVWLPEKIEKSYKTLKEFPDDEPSLVSSFCYYVDSNLNVTKKPHNISGGWKLNFLRYASQGCTLMFNRKLKDVILPISPDMIYDAYIGFTASLIGNRYYIGENLMYYRIHEGNSFVKSEEKLSKTEKFRQELSKPIPYWYESERYKNLLVIKTHLGNKVLPERLDFINGIIDLFNANKFKIIKWFIFMNELSYIKRIQICGSLFIKMILGIKNKY